MDGTGFAAIVHPWESGTDDSPRWLEVLNGFDPGEVPPYRRGDRNFVDPSERPTDHDYDRFVHLVDLQRRNGWDQKATLGSTPFCVQDVLVNSILHRADEDLIWLGRRIGADTSEVEQWAQRTRDLFSLHFWDDATGLFQDVDVRAGRPIRVNTAATFLPMWAGLCTDEQSRRLIAHLEDPAEYWVDEGNGYMVTTASRTEPSWSPVRYWRGPVWVLMNWFVHGGLERYGRTDLAQRVRRDTLALLSRSGFVEYYDAVNGAPCGARAFSWSASLTLDLLLD